MSHTNKNSSEVALPRLGRVESFNSEHSPRVEAFLDELGYTAREVRAIARHAIALWETQPQQ